MPVKVRAKECAILKSYGSFSKDCVRNVINWNPSKACVPGRTTRDSVNVCLILSVRETLSFLFIDCSVPFLRESLGKMCQKKYAIALAPTPEQMPPTKPKSL